MDTTSRLALLFLIMLVIGTAFGLFVYPLLRRYHLDQKPFPGPWLAIVSEQLPVYRHLSADEQQQLRKLIIRFLHSKSIVGCAGQQIDDRVRLTIAAQACLLLLNRRSSEFASVHTILVYPAAFVAQHQYSGDDGLVHQHMDVLAGESWETGKVVLAWDDVIRGIRNFADGHNVVLHEFAHQLDQESGVTNGSPILDSSAAHARWAQIFSGEFLKLQQDAESNRAILLDAYGAQDPAEFFAVTTESFYEQPWQLAEHHPALFDELLQYFRSDPRRWQPLQK